MLIQIFMDLGPHRVKDYFYTLPTRQFRSWNKIAVASNQNYAAYEVLVSQRRNVQAKTDVNSFLLYVVRKIFIRQIVNLNLSL